MSGTQIKLINQQIPYEEGKIYFENGRGFTSKLIQRLYSLGYRASQSGAVHYLRDNAGNKLTSAFSWEGLLFETAKIMR